MTEGDTKQTKAKKGFMDATNSVGKIDITTGFAFAFNDTLYIGTYENGLYKLDKNAVAIELVDPTSVSLGFAFEYDGVMYVGTTNQVLCKFNERIQTLEQIDATSMSSGFAFSYNDSIYI